MRANEIINEIDMSPSALRRQANQVYGAMAGIEFEMIVPNAAIEDQDADLEEDYSYDPRVTSLADIRNFFDDRDGYNSTGEVNSVIRRLSEDYVEWRYNEIYKDWQANAEELIKEYIENDTNEWNEDEELRAAFAELELSDEEQLRARDAGAEAQKINATSSKQLEYLKDSPDYQNWTAALRRVEAALDEKVADEMKVEGYIYGRLKTEFEDEALEDDTEYTEQEWLDADGIHRMQDVLSIAHLQWPHWQSSSPGGSWPLSDVAASFSQTVGRDIEYDTNYHGADRSSWVTDQEQAQDMIEDPKTSIADWGSYVVEPDGSLTPNNIEDAGLEFISPPLPLSLLLDELNKVREWALKNRCYTGRANKTGLHMNVSILNLNSDTLDYVKLVLLLGDNYLLDEFARKANTYCKSSLEELQNKIKNRPEQTVKALGMIKSGLNEEAGKLFQKTSGTKFYSIHDQDGYIEFRSPGGDWLSDNVFKKLETTLLRMVVAVDAACDAGKHEREYATKLYKLLSPAVKETRMEKFHTGLVQAIMSSKSAPEQAAAFIAAVKAERAERAKDNGPMGKYWWKVTLADSDVSPIEVVATGREEAIAEARARWNMTSPLQRELYPNSAFNAVALKPFEEETPSVPAETWPANNYKWEVLSRDGEVIFNFWTSSAEQGEANAEARRMLNSTYRQWGHRGPFEINLVPR